nr:MAG TPA: hypothetical protein [Caudoviricetes sp.]DAM10712.1 MAG TPA: hypothetical protein [Caudoviricetes sp.]
MTEQDIKEKIKTRISEIEAEQKTYENCRMVCLGIKEELNKLLSSLEEGSGDEKQEAGDNVVGEDETVQA